MGTVRLTKAQRTTLGVEIGDYLPIGGRGWDAALRVRPSARDTVTYQNTMGMAVVRGRGWDVNMRDVPNASLRVVRLSVLAAHRACLHRKWTRRADPTNVLTVDLWAVHCAMAQMPVFAGTPIQPASAAHARIPGMHTKQLPGGPRTFGWAESRGHRMQVNTWGPDVAGVARVASYVSTIGHELTHLSGRWDHSPRFKAAQAEVFEAFLGGPVPGLPSVNAATWKHGRCIRKAVQAAMLRGESLPGLPGLLAEAA
jgi:hypothetical protein